MAHKKPQKHCNYIKPHPAHVWPADADARGVPKLWCTGTAVDPSRGPHVHVWDQTGPVMRTTEETYAKVTVLWQGVCECPCGQSAWLKDGRSKRAVKAKEVRFPKADAYERTLALKAKLDRDGPDAMSEEDKAELQEIADALIEAFTPLVQAFQKMAEQVMEYLMAFLDRLDPETVREMHRLAQTYGEHADSPVDTIELRDAETGKVIAEHIIGYDPIPSTQHAATDLVEDALQPNLAPNPHSIAEVARKAIAEPFNEPFHVNIAGAKPGVISEAAKIAGRMYGLNADRHG